MTRRGRGFRAKVPGTDLRLGRCEACGVFLDDPTRQWCEPCWDLLPSDVRKTAWQRRRDSR
jgi:hypothetical protein